MPQNSFQMSLLAQQTPIPEAIPIARGTCVAVCSPWHQFKQVSGSPLSCFLFFFSIFGSFLLLLTPGVFSPPSMDGFRLVKLNEVIRQVDIVITCTGTRCRGRVGPQILGPFSKGKGKNVGKATGDVPLPVAVRERAPHVAPAFEFHVY